MKKIELAITNAWQKNASWLRLLSPISKAYEIFSNYQKNAYQTGQKHVYKAPIPVLVIGNITVGGSGKTPLIIAMIHRLQQKDVPVGVISRGYGGDTHKMPQLVNAHSLPSDVGDEACLIVQKTGVPMAVCPNRQQACELLLGEYPNLRLIISDDGLQHFALHRDDEWIVVDVDRGFGNEKLFPQGFLREPVSRLDGATVIYHYHKHFDAQKSPHPLTLYLSPSEPVPLLAKHTGQGGISPRQHMPSKRVYALTGIGYPKRFFETVRSMGYEVIERPFGDHHHFRLSDIEPLSDYPIVVTAKDAVKLRPLATTCLTDGRPSAIFNTIWVVEVEGVLSWQLCELIDKL